jgi:hypothetical protein
MRTMNMNQIKPSRWSHDWYELTSTEELILLLAQAKDAIHARTKKNRETWKNRIRQMEEELLRRQEAVLDPVEMEM